MDELLIRLSAVSSVFPLLTGAWFSINFSGTAKPFFWFFYLVVFIESTGNILGLYSIHNVGLYTTFFLLECIFYAWCFHHWLFPKETDKWLFGILTLLLITWVISSASIKFSTQFNVIARMLECTIMVFYSATLLVKLTQTGNIYILQDPKFWFASGTMLYFSFTLFVFSFYKIVEKNNYYDELFRFVFYIHSIINILSNLLFSIAFACRNNRFKLLLKI